MFIVSSRISKTHLCKNSIFYSKSIHDIDTIKEEEQRVIYICCIQSAGNQAKTTSLGEGEIGLDKTKEKVAGFFSHVD